LTEIKMSKMSMFNNT